jgi:L-ascorbate metabolism protein UlaG (beta-lactamase superfamily)
MNYRHRRKEQVAMKPLRLTLGLLCVTVVLGFAYLAFNDRRSAGPAAIDLEGALTSPEQPAGLEIKYIANEGVLLSANGKQVLIDGLHREYKLDYAFLPTAQREQLEHARAPFERIDLLLVSHLHLDHFHPEAVGLYLRHNPKASLVSSEQVVDEVKKNFSDYAAIQSRMQSATPAVGEKVTMKVAGVELEILGLAHGSERFRWIQNLGHVITLGGKKILHIGDADTSIETFEKFNLDEAKIDIAILPFWFLLGKEGQVIINQHIKPRQIIAVHISPAQSMKVAEQLRAVFPEAVAFTTMLEKRQY